MKTIQIIGSVIGIFLVLILGVFLSNNRESGVLGQANTAKNSTTTGATWCEPVTNRTKVLKVGAGVLGNVIVTNETTGAMDLFDATSTNTVMSGYSTTTLAKIAVSAAEGTYTFNSSFSRGLIAVQSGATSCMASSTITWE